MSEPEVPDRSDRAQAVRFLEAVTNLVHVGYLLRVVQEAPPERLSDAQRVEATAALLSWLPNLLDQLARVDQDYVARMGPAGEGFLDAMAQGEQPHGPPSE